MQQLEAIYFMINIRSFNPDVLSCLANLSNDEVFTPPKLANEILDLLPQSLWSDKNAAFLDPCSKTGVFLREIAKRLLKGLEKEIPDLHERINHIFKNQIFGIAITELTAHLTRRSVYCSKHAAGKYSVCDVFDDDSGNIRFERIEHTWKDGKCVFCGANQENYDRGGERETHAYPFIHYDMGSANNANEHELEDIFNMKFDVIVGNPPYQLSTGGSGRQAKPIYQYFVQQAKKMNPRYLVMIIPSRWFSGGMGLDQFREEMLNDERIRKLVDYSNAKDCFSGISVSGGVNYFLWDKDNKGDCEFVSIHNGTSSIANRRLNEFPILVRYNDAVNIIHKIKSKKEKVISDIVSSINPFGFVTSSRGEKEKTDNSAVLYSSEGKGFVDVSEVKKGIDLLSKYKVMVSQTTSEHAGETDKNGKFRVISRILTLGPNEVCTHSYIIVGSFNKKEEADNLNNYLKTKFSRFLLLQAISSIHITKEKFVFVPLQDFSEPWTDEKLYKKYGLTQDEIAFIESMIRPMEAEEK
jgi:site-specific DNA-methyltransferase (adenine-specific)